MTLKIELPPHVESNLKSQARDRGLSVERYAEKLLEKLSSPLVDQRLRDKTILQLFEPLRGLDLNLERSPSIGRSVDL